MFSSLSNITGSSNQSSSQKDVAPKSTGTSGSAPPVAAAGEMVNWWSPLLRNICSMSWIRLWSDGFWLEVRRPAMRNCKCGKVDRRIKQPPMGSTYHSLPIEAWATNRTEHEYSIQDVHRSLQHLSVISSSRLMKPCAVSRYLHSMIEV